METGFDSQTGDHSSIAQLAEHEAVNFGVPGSSPGGGVEKARSTLVSIFGVRLYSVNKRAARAIGAAVAQLLYTQTVIGSNPILPTYINTSKSIMETLYKLLSDTQASLFLLFQKTWVYHWHIVGPDFKQIHDLFGEQYVSIQEEVDRISEHMRFLGIKPISSLSRVLEVSGVGEAKTNISEMEMIKDLLEGHKKIIDMLGEVAEEAEAQKSRGTVNLVDDMNEAHGKFVWMLRSFTE